MATTVDISYIQSKLYEDLKPTGWANLLRSFLVSSDFTLILEQLLELTQDKKRFTPTLKDVFAPFHGCSYTDLHTVFINREPFNEIGEASGLAFDSSRLNKEHYVTAKIFDAVQRTIYVDSPYSRDTDLTRWANQGILLLNANLTVGVNNSFSHTEIWKPFTAFLLDALNSYNQGLHFVFFGKDVVNLASNINIEHHYKYFVEHPTTASQNKGTWESSNIFPILSKSIQKNYNKTITW